MFTAETEKRFGCFLAVRRYRYAVRRTFDCVICQQQPLLQPQPLFPQQQNMRMMRIKIHRQPSFPHPFPKQPIQAPPSLKNFKSVFTLLCTRAAFAHNPQAGLCKAHLLSADYQSQPQPQPLLHPQPLLFPQQQNMRIIRMIIHKQPSFPHPLPHMFLHLLFCAHFIIRQCSVLVTANKKLFVKV